LRPTLRATGTAGVWQNQPALPPGSANAADSAATARSQVATSWQPAAVAIACTLATTTCGTSWMVRISFVQSRSRSRTPARSRAATSAKSCPAENALPSAPSTMPVASLRPAVSNASSSSRRCGSDSELRRSGRFMVIRTVSPSDLTSRCS
jgi:hypothetical protein